jgi:hypothetical protein
VFSSNEKYFSGLSPTNINGKAMALCEVLFVDEVTMVTKEIFNLIDKKLREIRGQIVDKRFINYSFGGVMLILTGDLGQVPCVTKKGDDISEFNAMFNHMDEFKKFNNIKRMVNICIITNMKKVNVNKKNNVVIAMM